MEFKFILSCIYNKYVHVVWASKLNFCTLHASFTCLAVCIHIHIFSPTKKIKPTWKYLRH